MDRRLEAFPEGLPSEPGGEREELLALGAELRHCVAEAPLSSEFAESLRGRLEERPWELRTALRERPLLRAAAALLVISTIAAPVSALVLLLPNSERKDPIITMEPPVQVPDVILEESRPEIPVIPPSVPGFEGAFNADWQASVGRCNRMAVMQAQWFLAHSEADPSTAAQAPARLDWSNAETEDLVTEFERRALLGITTSLPSSLLERIESLLASTPEVEQVPALRAWNWILHGEGPPPVPQVF